MKKTITASLALFALGAASTGVEAQPANMTFFITSVGPGKGADLGGLAGADRIARSLRRRPAPAARPGTRI